MKYDVLLYETNRILLGQLANIVSATPNFNLVAYYQHRKDALGQGKVFNPNLILLDIEGGNAVTLINDFRREYPNASIICIGERWDAEGAIHLVQAGAKGYLIKPFSSEELQEAVNKFAKSGMKSDCHVMAFFSPKGKSGKTTLIANMAMSLARKTGEQVGIIDADLQFGDMAVFFNLSSQSTIVEATRDMNFLSPVSLNAYYTNVTNNVSVLCGTKNPSFIDRVSIDSFEKLINMSRSLFRYLLIDIPAGFNPTSIAAAEAADATYLVTMNNGAYEMKHMRRAVEIFRDWPDVTERLKPVFTRVSPCNEESRLNLQEKLGFPVEAIIPNEYMMVSAAADNGRMALDIQPDSNLSISIGNMANRVIKKPHHIEWDKS